jgi:hypothetical protein
MRGNQQTQAMDDSNNYPAFVGYPIADEQGMLDHIAIRVAAMTDKEDEWIEGWIKGFIEGWAEGRIKRDLEVIAWLRQKGKSAEVIADLLNLSVTFVEAVIAGEGHEGKATGARLPQPTLQTLRSA